MTPRVFFLRFHQILNHQSEGSLSGLRVRRVQASKKKVKNILATVHPGEVLPSVVERTMDEFGLGNAEAVGLKTALWDQALEAFLTGGKLAESEVAYLRALRQLFWPEGRDKRLLREGRLGKPESAKSIRVVGLEPTT